MKVLRSRDTIKGKARLVLNLLYSRVRSDFFFFSSRRRHTRLQGDWSSDVCSSDLDDEDLGVGKVDELEHAVHHRVAERDERVHEAEQEAVEQDLRKDRDEEFEVHGAVGGGVPVDHPANAAAEEAYFFIAGAAIASRFASLFSLHFSGLSLLTCMT